jgi:hypothetical protein
MPCLLLKLHQSHDNLVCDMQLKDVKFQILFMILVTFFTRALVKIMNNESIWA